MRTIALQLFAIVSLVVVASCAKPIPEEDSSSAPEVTDSAQPQNETKEADTADTSESDTGTTDSATETTAAKSTDPKEGPALIPTTPPAGPPLPKLLLSEAELADGWIQLFDGVSLFGWTPTNDVNWSVADGFIRADSGPPGLLVTSVPFADFELRVDFRIAKSTNSGIFLRTLFDSKKPDPTKDFYELNLCDDNPFPTGSFVGRKKIEKPLKTEGEWKTFHVKASGHDFEVSMDGNVVFEFSDDGEGFRRSGYIGLQKNEGLVEFRNVFVKPLGPEPIFDGEDLAGWRNVPGTKSNFRVDEGTIHVTDGPGFLETEQTWDDFVLQLQAKTNGAKLNSGVFFRAMTGTEEAPSNGYEMQIQNGFVGGDRSNPEDAGTGAIFRRTKARWVIPNDQEWFHATLIADGNRIAAWVNGLQVTDWQDDREPDDNPRRGQRLEAGHISLQGHDPTTDLQFRELKIARIPGETEDGIQEDK